MGADVGVNFELYSKSDLTKLDDILIELGFEAHPDMHMCMDLERMPSIGLKDFVPTLKKVTWDPRHPFSYLAHLRSSFSVGQYQNDAGFYFSLVWSESEGLLILDPDREHIFKSTDKRTLDLAAIAPHLDPIIKAFPPSHSVAIYANNL